MQKQVGDSGESIASERFWGSEAVSENSSSAVIEQEEVKGKEGSFPAASGGGNREIIPGGGIGRHGSQNRLSEKGYKGKYRNRKAPEHSNIREIQGRKSSGINKKPAAGRPAGGRIHGKNEGDILKVFVKRD